MSDYQIQITSIGASGRKAPKPAVVLPLSLHGQTLSISKASVRNFVRYQIEILCDEKLAIGCDANWRVLLNGEEIKSRPHWRAENRSVVLPASDLYFSDLLGYALLQLKINNPDGKSKILDCPPIKILFKKEDKHTIQTEAIAKYVMEQGSEYLWKNYDAFYDPKSGIVGKTLKSSDIVSFIEKIIQVYEFDLEYFRSNSRAKIRIEGRIDALEKLRSFTSETLRFIATHPEELVPSSQSTGIKSGALSFIPRRSWIQGDRMDRDVYENRIVLGFLKTVINHVSRLLKESGSSVTWSKEEEEELEKQGLFDSSRLIQKGLLFEHEKLLSLNSKLRGLFLHYQEFLQAEPLLVNIAPEPTAVFMSIPAYNRVYKLLYDWFNVRNVKLVKSSFFLEPEKVSRIYEYFCLIKLIKRIQQEGFDLIKQEEVKWHTGDDVITEDINNVYLFGKNMERLTLYYEPSIGTSLNKVSELFLYRNSTGRISENGHLAYGNSDECYTPDYVLKYEKNGNDGPAKYLIADAKFSQSDEVINKQLLELIFKYRMSISPAREEDSVTGLSVFCGKNAPERTLPLFNVANPISGEFLDRGIFVSDVQPEIDDYLIPRGFFANRDNF